MKEVLLVIDLIEDYFDQEIWPESEIPGKRLRLVSATNSLVATCRASKVPVIWVRQEFLEDMSDAFPHARRSGMRYAIRGTVGSRLLSELDVDPNDRIITKRRFSAFHGTDLETMLETIGAGRILVAGITTAWCVRSTAVDAYQLDYEVVVARDCTAAFTEAAHRAALAEMDGYIAQTMTNDEIAETLSSSG